VLRYHHDSEFGPGPRRPLGLREQFAIRLRMRELAYARRLPAKQEWVGVALLKYVGSDGRCDPSHATLARHVGCDVSTVLRALKRLADLGIVRWVRRLVRDGWRTEQTSNAYVFCDRQIARETSLVLNVPKRSTGAMSSKQPQGAWPPLPERTVEQQLYELRHKAPMGENIGAPHAPAPPAHTVDEQLAALGFRRGPDGELLPLEGALSPAD
jgi:DNA-binding transcriptional MocR family regulator